ncbi:MAG TPA: hypothetical protein ENF58_01540 [Candidatus Altiarchaeales archaeon]|nr:hypothetical protein [Candidatus Altiarchaeales archaeon]
MVGIDKETKNRIEQITNAAQLAAVLEVSTEKPGNVTPTHDFSDTRYEDFLAGSIAIAHTIEEATLNGYKAGKGEISISEIGIGRLIFEGVSDVKKSHSGGNTHLGTLMLMIPIASAAGMCIPQRPRFNELRKNIRKIIEGSTVDDSRNFYKAIEIARVGGIRKLIKKDISFHELMEVSTKRDRIAEELTNGMKIIFEVGIPNLEKFYNEKKNIREAILWVYLLLLSKYPDTFIAKKVGILKAKEISEKAEEVLKGKISTEEFDRELRTDENSLNPGTTADMVAAILMLWFIKNY